MPNNTPIKGVYQWAANIGITQEDANIAMVLGVLIVLAAFGGWVGEVGYWGMILLAVIAIATVFKKGA